MALTPAGNALTNAHRAQQLAVRAQSLEGLLRMWAAVDVTNLADTIEVFAQAAALLAGNGFDQSAAAAANYYGLFRRVEIGQGATIATAGKPGVEFLAGQIRGAALSGILDARKAGAPIGTAKRNGLVRAIGTMSKLVLAGGRNTIISGTQADRRALGWARVTSGDPCAFCRMLSSRGPAYKSEKSADFQPHDHCGCTPEAVFRGDQLAGSTAVAQAEEHLWEYSTAQEWARGNVTRTKATSNNALNNYRQWLDAGKPEPGQTSTDGVPGDER